MTKTMLADTQLLTGDLFNHCLSTYQHSLRVGDELYRFASYLNLENIESVYILGVLHDIGKLNIPHVLLNKKDRLTEKEFKHIQLHTEYGERIVEGLKHLPNTYSLIVKFHHENFDGTGYYGLIGKEIPLLARMIRIIDSYDTMLYGRIYQIPRTQTEVIQELFTLRGKQFDPELVTDFLSFLKQRYSIQLQYGT
ncbi:HD-GYP domain-containing protein [Robertmurraya sp. GLU-23]